jgi:hypothetical protein
LHQSTPRLDETCEVFDPSREDRFDLHGPS